MRNNIEINLSVTETAIVMDGLSHLPYKDSYKIIEKLKLQIAMQLQEGNDGKKSNEIRQNDRPEDSDLSENKE